MRTLENHRPISRIFLFMLSLMLWNCSSSADLILPATEDTPLSLKSGKISKPLDKTDVIEPYYIFNDHTLILKTNQGNEIGTLYIYTDSEKGNIFVSVTTIEGWKMKNIQLFIGDKNNLPVNGSKKLMLKKFNVTESFETPTNTYLYEFNSGSEPEYAVVFRSEVEFTDADSQVTKTEIASTGDTDLNIKNSYGFYFIYSKMAGG